mmetsp:Transcript_14438/g.49314  ORF Transcript_14438/g.49314 Transcript_14438/m.49314 type:complete len:603 (-) Transcript_14438:83-1891(-)
MEKGRVGSATNDDALEKAGDLSVNGSESMHQKLVDADESKSWKARLSGLFPSFTSKPKTHKANSSAASESSSGTKKSEYSRRVQELRELVRQQKLEVKPLWNRDEDDLDFQEAIWCSEDYEYEESHESGGGEKHAASSTSHADDDEPRQAPTANFISMYGVHVNRWWVETSRIMLAITFILVGLLSFLSLQLVIQKQYGEHVLAWAIGAVFVAVSVPISLHDIHMHILHYVSPLQRHYIRILWMVPIYSIESWLALRFNDHKLIMETLREAYEAYVVYSFFRLLLEFMGPPDIALAKMAKLASEKGTNKAKHIAPCCCLKQWTLDTQFLRRTSIGVWQYVFIRTLVAVMVIIFQQYDMYGEGHFSVDKAYVWTLIIINCSQCWALYCLVVFYIELKKELMSLNPLGKFLVVKAVVFFSWWQQIIVTFLVEVDMIPPVLEYTSEDVAKGLQNLLVVIEMFVYAICLHAFFPYTDFRAGGPLSKYLDQSHALLKGPRAAIVDMLPTDIMQEGKQYLAKTKKTIVRKVLKQEKSVQAHAAKANRTQNIEIHDSTSTTTIITIESQPSSESVDHVKETTDEGEHKPGHARPTLQQLRAELLGKPPK